MNETKSNEGFTLVELSIVLIIIGLLIGGILAAQSMIQTAKIQSFIRQIDQFDVAVTNFQTKYNFLPGDSTSFPNGGDGDGVIKDATNSNTNINDFTGEVSNFWTHLSLSGFMPDKIIYSNDASAGVKAGINTPIAKIGKSQNDKGAAVAFWNDDNYQRKLYYWFGDYSGTTSAIYNDPGIFRSAFTPLEILAVDTKIDDGLAIIPGAVFGFKHNEDGTKCNNGPTYLTTNNVQCSVFIAVQRNQ